jgi:hypothetical protein
MPKKLVSILITLAVVAALSSAYVVAQSQDKDDQKAGNTTTVTGCLAKGDSPNEFSLTADNGRKYELRSDSVSMAEHVGHKVTVTGAPAKESAGEEKEEKGERHEAHEGHEAAHLQVSKLQHVSETCK